MIVKGGGGGLRYGVGAIAAEKKNEVVIDYDKAKTIEVIGHTEVTPKLF